MSLPSADARQATPPVGDIAYAAAVSQAAASSTATFLMTDIEGSTRLWEEQHASMVVALEAHDALLRTAVEDAGGTVVKTTGDGLLAAFERPAASIRAALGGQRALAGHAWPTMAPLRVRMAIHAGAAETRDGDYFGPSLNRVARLLAIGHGGQVLVSSAAAALFADDLPDGASLLDRGEHHLRDLSRTEHVFQLAATDLRRDFPPLRSGAAPTNIPADLTSFVGREREAAEIQRLLGVHRLVSLVGVGGTGKTRLALHVATELVARHADGAWLVELAPLRDPGLLLPEVARSLHIADAPGQPLLDVVCDFLREKDLLLVLDNCEHMVGEAADVAERLLGACRSLQVLATSREALGVPGEATFPVPSLAIPPTLDHLDLAAVAASEAVALFVERATTTEPGFRLDATTAGPVVEICRRLDGIPLALELAAARVNVLSVEEIALGLGDRFRLLTGGRRTAVPRQQTLQAMIDWSWDLLTEADQRLLRRLSVFAGGWTLEAAAAVAGDQEDPGLPPSGASRLETLDGLGRLADRSLLVVEHGGSTRYGMLETIRQYARDRLLASGEAVALQARHLARFRRLTEDAEPGLDGRDMAAWLGRLDTELDNLRAAMDWALDEDPEATVSMAAALNHYWRSRLVGSEGLDRLVEAIDAFGRLAGPPPGGANARLRLGARVHSTAARVAAMTGQRRDSSRAWATEAVQLATESGDAKTLSTALVSRVFVLMFASLPTDDVMGGQADAADHAASIGDWINETFAAAGRAEYQMAVDIEGANVWVVRAAEAARRSGNPFSIGLAALARGRFRGYRGDLDAAREAFGEASAQFAATGDHRMELVARSDLAHALRHAGALDDAEAAYRDVIRDWQRLGHRGAVANLLESFGFIAIERGDARHAAVLFGAAERLRIVSETAMLPHERVEYDRQVARARTQVDAASFDEAWARGAAFTIDEAVTFANNLEGAPSA